MAANEQSVIYEGAFGFRNMATATPMSPDTIFRIASMVKLLTSVAALQLVERGKLKLDEPAGISIRRSLAQVLAGFDAKGVPQLRPAQKPLTLRNLLTHTSGLSYPLWDTNVGRYLKAARGNPALPRMPLMFEPGTRWAYGGSIDRVSRMVEIAAGQNLDRYFRDHITGPLGMNDTGFAITERSARVRPACMCGARTAKLVAQPLEKPKTPTAFSGGGSLYSTAPDYLALLQALLNGGSLRGTQHPAAGNRDDDVRQPDRQYRCRSAQDGQSGAVERRGFFPGRSSAMGTWTHDQCRSRCRTAARRAA